MSPVRQVDFHQQISIQPEFHNRHLYTWLYSKNLVIHKTRMADFNDWVSLNHLFVYFKFWKKRRRGKGICNLPSIWLYPFLFSQYFGHTARLFLETCWEKFRWNFRWNCPNGNCSWWRIVSYVWSKGLKTIESCTMYPNFVWKKNNSSMSSHTYFSR